jgi:hypothetical protein
MCITPLDKLRDLSLYPFARGLCTSSDLITKNPFLKEEVSISSSDPPLIFQKYFCRNWHRV